MAAHVQIEKLMKKHKFNYTYIDDGYWSFQSTHGLVHIQNWDEPGILNFWIYVTDIKDYSDLSSEFLIWLLKKNATTRQGAFAVIENPDENRRGLVLLDRIQTEDLDWSEVVGSMNSLLVAYDATKDEIGNFLKKD